MILYLKLNPFLSRMSSSDVRTFFTFPLPPAHPPPPAEEECAVRRWSVLAGRSEEVGQQPQRQKSPSAFYSLPTRTAPILWKRSRNNCASHESRYFLPSFDLGLSFHKYMRYGYSHERQLTFTMHVSNSFHLKLRFLTYLLIYLLTYSLTYLLTYSFTHLLTYLLNYLLTH